ncbi:hypothetical protein Tcan_01604, partial [Toxocara canis]
MYPLDSMAMSNYKSHIKNWRTDSLFYEDTESLMTMSSRCMTVPRKFPPFHLSLIFLPFHSSSILLPFHPSLIHCNSPYPVCNRLQEKEYSAHLRPPLPSNDTAHKRSAIRAWNSDCLMLTKIIGEDINNSHTCMIH